jgi:hypothetical protein
MNRNHPQFADSTFRPGPAPAKTNGRRHQSLDLADLPEGTYWLVVTTDPFNMAAERKSNSASAKKIQLYKLKG